MLPLLKNLKDNQEHSNSELYESLCLEFNITDEEKEALLSSGIKIMDNRIGWAKTYLKKAKLLEYTKRGYTKITENGLKVLSENPSKIDNKYLERFNDFLEFRNIKEQQFNFLEGFPKDSSGNIHITMTKNTEETPDELIENGYNSIKANIKQELLNKLRESTPDFFERTILELLEKMDYGKGEVTGKTGDGGIDGIIYQDKLGLDKIYLQAKRFAENNPVSAHMVRDFMGALEVNGVNKGVFITTSRFPKESLQNTKSQKSIILIDGNKLVDLMYEFNLGVHIEKTFEMKKIDLDYFAEE